MYYTECARIAERHPGLAAAVEKVDAQLATTGASGVIHASDWASFLRLDPNRVRAVFEKLADRGLLVAEQMVECAYCGMPAPRADYQQEIQEEGEYRCTSCDRPLMDGDVRSITVYRRGREWSDPLLVRETASEQSPAMSVASELSFPRPADPPTAGPAYCRVITRDGKRECSRDEYADIVARSREFDMFVDGMTMRVAFRDADGERQKDELTLGEFAMVAEYIESRTVLRPFATSQGRRCQSSTAAVKLFEKARGKVNAKVGRNGFCAFRIHKAPDPAQKAFEFAPPADLRYCLIVPIAPVVHRAG